MVSTIEVSKLINVDPKEIRKFARKSLIKGAGGWDFSDKDIQAMIQHFSKQEKTVSAAPALQVPQTGINLDELKRFAEDFVRSNYGIEFNIPLVINSRLQRALGRFVHARLPHPDARMPKRLELSDRLIKYQSEETVIDVLKHELIHFALYMTRKPYRDGESYFENELKKHGSSSTQTIQSKGPAHQYVCSSCGDKIHRNRKLKNIERYHTICCKARLEYQGQVIL